MENKLEVVIEIVLEMLRHGNDPNIVMIFNLVDEIEKEAIKRNYIKDNKSDYFKIMESRKTK